MVEEDFVWAAQLMEERRERYARLSPVFWRPATGVADAHRQFMRATAGRDGAVAIRTDHGFLLSTPQDRRCVVDDFAVDADHRWETDGRALLRAAWEQARSPDQPVLRAVTARGDEPKRELLAGLGLVVTARWWVKELAPTSRAEWGPVVLDGVEAVLVPAPPVYDPGGPVCLLGDVEPARAARAATAAARRGAVLAIVQRDRSPSAAPEAEPELEAAGFHNPSEFYEGVPARP